MSLKDQLEVDIHLFFENIETQDPTSRAKTLRQLIDKYAHLSTAPCILDKYDFNAVKEAAHNFYTRSAFPKKIGSNRQEICAIEANVLAIIEGTITVLNGKDCLKKIAKFDYRD